MTSSVMNIEDLYRKAVEASQIFVRDKEGPHEFRLEEYRKNDKTDGYDVVISFLLPRDLREQLAQISLALVIKFERVYKLIEFDSKGEMIAVKMYDPKK